MSELMGVLIVLAVGFILGWVIGWWRGLDDMRESKQEDIMFLTEKVDALQLELELKHKEYEALSDMYWELKESS